MINPTNEQETWLKLIDKHGEDKAREILSNALQEAAKQVLTKTYPDVFGCSIKENDDSFIFHVGVTLTYPWPG